MTDDTLIIKADGVVIRTRYVFHSRVQSVGERERVVRGYKEADQTVTITEPLGWFVHLEGSQEALFVGYEKPPFQKGQTVKVTIEGL